MICIFYRNCDGKENKRSARHELRIRSGGERVSFKRKNRRKNRHINVKFMFHSVVGFVAVLRNIEIHFEMNELNAFF